MKFTLPLKMIVSILIISSISAENSDLNLSTDSLRFLETPSVNPQIVTSKTGMIRVNEWCLYTMSSEENEKVQVGECRHPYEKTWILQKSTTSQANYIIHQKSKMYLSSFSSELSKLFLSKSSSQALQINEDYGLLKDTSSNCINWNWGLLFTSQCNASNINQLFSLDHFYDIQAKEGNIKYNGKCLTVDDKIFQANPGRSPFLFAECNGSTYQAFNILQSSVNSSMQIIYKKNLYLWINEKGNLSLTYNLNSSQAFLKTSTFGNFKLFVTDKNNPFVKKYVDQNFQKLIFASDIGNIGLRYTRLLI